MKKILFILFVFCFSTTLYAQYEVDRSDRYLFDLANPATNTDTEIKNGYVNLSASFDGNSNAITNRFFQRLVYTGEFIDDEQKDHVSARLSSANRFGLDAYVKLSGVYKWKKNLFLTVGVSDRLFTSFKFSEDVFNLVFYGNKMYAGQTASLTPLAATSFDYMGFSFGAMTKLSDDKIMLGGNLSILRGGRFTQVKMDRGTLFTEENGAYLDLDSKFQFVYTENNSGIIPQKQGSGLGMNLFGSINLEKGSFNFEVNDIGFIKWRNLSCYEGDSLYRYDGYPITDVLNPDGAIVNEVTLDSLAAQMNLVKKQKDLLYFMPTTFHVNYIYHYSDKLSIVAGAKYMLNAAYIPRIYVKPVYYLKSNLMVAPTIAYGGFGKADLILSAAYRMKSLMFSADIFAAEYFLLPNASSGHGGTLSITKLF